MPPVSHLGLAEIIWTLAWSGSPLYVLALSAQGVWLHQSGRFSLAAVAATALFSVALTILAGVVIWGRFFGPQDIMLWQVINLPALLACLVVFPVVGILVRIGFAR